jgi:glycosyltransferase involved in cell wall biosynthesis
MARPTSSRKLRVLSLIDRPITTGGGERMASIICMETDPARYDRWLCSSRSTPAETYEDVLRERGVELLVLHRESPLKLSSWRPLVQLLRRERIDVLHAHKFGSNLWGTIVGRLARVPVVIAHEHSWSYEGQPLRRFLDREIIGRGANAFVAVSREDERCMREIEGVRPEVIEFIQNGIPPLVRQGHDIRSEVGIDPAAPLAVWIGQMRDVKRLDVLVDAVAVAARRTPGLRVLLAGHGPEEGPARARARAAGIEENLVFLGLRNDVADVLAAADVALLTSDREGSPLSVMEYMAAGLPVVATSVGGIRDLVEDGVHGILTPRGDPEAIGNALADLLGDEGRRRAMGNAARARQTREFSLDAVVRRVEDLYDRLFANTARARVEGWTPASRQPRT